MKLKLTKKIFLGCALLGAASVVTSTAFLTTSCGGGGSANSSGKYSFGTTQGNGWKILDDDLISTDLQNWSLHIKGDINPPNLGVGETGWQLTSTTNSNSVYYMFNGVTSATVICANEQLGQPYYCYNTSTGGFAFSGIPKGWFQWTVTPSQDEFIGTFTQSFVLQTFISCSNDWAQGVTNCWLQKPST